jgi:hypothetical protein
MNFWLDSKVTTTEREVFTLFDAIAQAGGMMGVIISVVSFFIADI